MVMCSYNDIIWKYEFIVSQNKDYEICSSITSKTMVHIKIQNKYHTAYICASNIWSHMLSTYHLISPYGFFTLPIVFLSAYKSITHDETYEPTHDGWDKKTAFRISKSMLQTESYRWSIYKRNFLLKSRGMLNMLWERWRWWRGMEEEADHGHIVHCNTSSLLLPSPNRLLH